jgi:hypothetical protein
MRFWTAAGLGALAGFGCGLRMIIEDRGGSESWLPILGATTLAGASVGADLRVVRSWVRRFGMWGWYGCFVTAGASGCAIAAEVVFRSDGPATPWLGAGFGAIGGLCWAFRLRHDGYELRDEELGASV